MFSNNMFSLQYLFCENTGAKLFLWYSIVLISNICRLSGETVLS
uniref:Uncharacterized protein n=1 Tax=Arundo donax TaxID=35708 RepID=A0A0A9D2K1_ARUDO